MAIQRLEEIFRAVFKLRPDTDVSNLDRNDEASWDSLTVVTLIAAIESEFHCEIDATEALRLVSYRDACAILEAKGVAA